MKKIEDRSAVQSIGKMPGRNDNVRNSQSLRLDKQIIRTLTGAELRLVGGAACTKSKSALQ
jgi:hypothetical protein